MSWLQLKAVGGHEPKQDRRTRRLQGWKSLRHVFGIALPHNTVRTFATAAVFLLFADAALAVSPGCRYINDHAVTFLYGISTPKRLASYSGREFDAGDRVNFVVMSAGSIDTARFTATARSGPWVTQAPDEEGRLALTLRHADLWEFQYYSPVPITVRFRLSCDPAGTWTPADPSDEWHDDSCDGPPSGC